MVELVAENKGTDLNMATSAFTLLVKTNSPSFFISALRRSNISELQTKGFELIGKIDDSFR
jgi:hypothetical protein